MKNTILLTACCLLLGLGRTSVLVAQQVQKFPERSTRLYVRTIPPGADIKLDGQSRGTSDRLFKVPPGVRKMTVEVELDGHYPKRQEVEIRGGRITRVELELEEQPQPVVSQPPVNPFKEPADWGADQVTGQPDTPRAGDYRTAWASLTPDGQQEWLVLEYRETVKPAEIQVYESYNPGAISKITVFDPGGKEVEIGKPSPKGIAIAGGIVVSKFPVKVDFPVRRVKLYLDSPKIKGWNEIDAVGLVDAQGKTHWAAKAEASSTFADRSSGRYAVAPPPPEAKIPEGAVKLSHVDDTADGKRSFGGSGQAVLFDRPAETKHVAAIQIFASRYGYPRPPNEDFHVYLLDQDHKVIKDLTYPYSMIERGAERWYTLAVPSVEVPEKFHVALSFNAHRTKGVYVGIDEGVEETHSLIGLPDRGYKPVTEGYDWMVRVYLVSDAQAIKSEPAVGGDDEDALAGFDPAPILARNRPASI